MLNQFQKIGLLANNNTSIVDTFEKLIHFLTKGGYDLVVESQMANLFSKNHFFTAEREDLGKHCDLVIVVGGDGTLLNAARAVVSYQVPIVGINRGRLGFLADILPEHMEKELNLILNGHYIEEKRFLLDTTIIRHDRVVDHGIGLNDVVLYSGNIARMVDFEVYINELFVLRQQADGIITATPTGSTAYALSAGGPILYPTLNAMTMTPMCPHTFSSRPIVIDSLSQVKLMVSPENKTMPKLSCDGQLHFDLQPGDQILIKRHKHELTLIHPSQHEYFSVLREKLGWSTHQIKG